jgi:hypothetical protein
MKEIKLTIEEYKELHMKGEVKINGIKFKYIEGSSDVEYDKIKRETLKGLYQSLKKENSLSQVREDSYL